MSCQGGWSAGELQAAVKVAQTEADLIASKVAAGAEAGYGRVPDYNGRRQEGAAPMPMTVFHSGPRRGEGEPGG